MAKRTESPAEAAAPQEYRKPRADVYTVVLVVALLIVLLATAALWMTMKQYDYMIKGGPSPTWHRPAAGSTLDVSRAVA